ncbi:hypothetical protein KHA96_11985 [Bacillus sp. FJAT-49711]|uniref:hypothetical protein n=1 Tax=Bacillus sp. FJAT-49711 TaxID=2833585 RepID=UPI001BC967D7|nr:hypothetical protein [Bacillus sp. FJAT-49711]MBS4219036.1 hypothetical protein [Bacillus sp. FJAT-49711]
MKLRALFGIFLVVISTACSSTKQTVVSDKVIYFGEGDYWNAAYIYNPELYDDKKVNWVEIEFKDSVLSQEDLTSIDIEIESRDGLLTGNAGNMETKMEGNIISLLVGTINFDTYEEDEYKITIMFKDKQDIIKLHIIR